LPFSEMIPINRPMIGEEEIQAVIKVLRSGILTEKSGCGPFASKFEKAFANYVGSKYAISFNNGTSALHAALIAAGVGPKDEVIVPSFTFVATAEVVVLAGARPVFVDIDPKTYCMNPEEVKNAINRRTKAMIPVHLYGHPCDMNPLIECAREHGIVVIEDAAQAHGAEYKGKKAGVLGDLACFSFYATKNMTTGEGGMITTNSEELTEKVRLIRSHGEKKPYETVMIGHNYRLPEIEAAIGIVQLGKLPKFLEARRKNAIFLVKELLSVESLQMPIEHDECKHSWYLFTIRLKDANSKIRNKMVKKLHEEHVGAAVYYPIPIHKMSYYHELLGKVNLPETEEAAQQVISLPVHPAIQEVELDHIASAVKKVVTSLAID